MAFQSRVVPVVLTVSPLPTISYHVVYWRLMESASGRVSALQP